VLILIEPKLDPNLPDFRPCNFIQFPKRILNFKKMIPTLKTLPPQRLPAIPDIHKCQVHDFGHIAEFPVSFGNLINLLDDVVCLFGFLGI
jgi:hypothetical protein